MQKRVFGHIQTTKARSSCASGILIRASAEHWILQDVWKESKDLDGHVRMRRTIGICMFEGMFSLDAAHFIKW